MTQTLFIPNIVIDDLEYASKSKLEKKYPRPILLTLNACILLKIVSIDVKNLRTFRTTHLNDSDGSICKYRFKNADAKYMGMVSTKAANNLKI